MSLYNFAFGENSKAELLLLALGLKREDCGRYRDCHIENDNIVIHTRNGGGNREIYQTVIDKLATHPLYVRDEDDSFDHTYCNVYFSFPTEYFELLKQLAISSPDMKPSEKWKVFFDQLEKQK